MAPNHQPQQQSQRRDPSSSTSSEEKDALSSSSEDQAEVSKDHQISTPLPKKPSAQNKPPIPKIKLISSKLVAKDLPSKSVTKHGSKGAKRKASKKRLLFSQGDVIVILESMIEYASKTAFEPRSHMKGFHEFVKESISFAGSTQTQLYEKVRRLREKYEKNAREENPGVFAKSHEGKLFELSKKIWVNNDGGNGLGNEIVWKRGQRGSVGLRKEGKKRMGEEREKRMGVDTGFMISAGRFCECVEGWSLDEEALKTVEDGLELISESKNVELEGKWEQLRVDEIEHYLKKYDSIREQMMLVLEAMKSYGA